MLKEFGESAKEAGITNVRSVLSDWLDSKEMSCLWEMDILHMMGGSPIVDALTREDAVASAMVGRWLPPGDRDLARSLIEANFEKLHEEFGEGFRPLWRRPSREMLITWET